MLRTTSKSAPGCLIISVSLRSISEVSGRVQGMDGESCHPSNGLSRSGCCEMDDYGW